jgi:N-acetylglutamate synthase-like GNAT family acetyltransferase
MQENLRRLTQEDLPHLRDFWIEHWGSEIMITRGRTVRYDEVEGFVLGDWAGLLTFLIRGDECEVTSLDSRREGRGIGTVLINEVVREVKERKCRRLFLLTTNDNLHALGFYQRRGFELAALHRGAINESRRIKPSIPLIGMNEIPLRDELELEMKL